MRKGSPGISRWLSLLVAVALLVLAVPGAAVAAEPTSKYNSKPAPPSTGTSPSKESSKPASSSTPSTTPSEAPAPTVPAKESKASTLPFTGFDLRWSVAIGFLLLCAGGSIVLVQRRQRHHG